MMRQAFLTVHGDAFDINTVRPEIEAIASCFGGYLAEARTGGGTSKHRALGAVGKALQRARVARGQALLGYARRVHEQMTKSTFSGGAVAKLDDGLRKLDDLLSREDVPARAAGEILERVDYATYYAVRRQAVEFQNEWKDFARANGARVGLAPDGEIPWYSKKVGERGAEWAKLAEEFLASRRTAAPVAEVDSDEEG